jgi:23S rRNA pseudouridine2605 synthase
MDLLPRSLRQQGVLPAGRLDRDTAGLLVLTNIGDLSHRITHPRYETEKEYEALVQGRPTPEKLRELERGIRLEGEQTAPARAKAVEPRGEETRVVLVIREGKKRQVRRMSQAIGHEVLELVRVRVGGLKLGDLPPGEWRELTPREVNALTGGEKG